MNFRNYVDNSTWDVMGGKPQANVNLVRQPSIYSLTFDEFQNTMGGIGKDFGSMNMDELLKNIWTAEETQALASSAGGEESGHNPSGNLQRQGSLTLPRTLSQKTVDEVWRDLIKDTGGSRDGSGNGGSSMPQRQPTLGEMTLEDFLVRAGVVREDMTEQIGRPTNNNGWFGDFSRSNNNTDLLIGFQQPNRSNGNLGNRMVDGNNLVPKHPPPLSLNSNHSQPQTQQHQQQPLLFPKPTNVAFASPMHLLNNAQLASPGRRGGMIGVPEHSMNGTLTGVGMVGLSTANVTAPNGSPANKISEDVITKSSVDTSSLSPVPYVINRGRKCSAVEKVVERRQRRMIKNRESAARSRARKQAYTFELEAEVAKLKEVNQELQRKQAEIMETQKNKDSDSVSRPWGNKRRCLRRTLTGPW
ncbi:bZIP transcription factor TRAB1-like [Gastrolobium bilobum]|uniref:bZIP transcription factor TRAB1-like n=1 Tax=Gastrolobium bilobum TaxID=150636 RepID=UPI002AB23CFB|nr:bZIP transcription factor TRAB1-like [Gastrolobium bilobum]